MMENIFWCGHEWITSERWGQVHPDKSHWWYDESCVLVDENNYLHLKTKNNPKYSKSSIFFIYNEFSRIIGL